MEQTLEQTEILRADFLRDLGDGLVLRRPRPEDDEAVAVFNAHVHSDDGPEKPDERIRIWTLDLLGRGHPTTSRDDFTVVEDTRTGQIVSSCNLISQVWAYGGVPFGVGRPEAVGTAPEYRKRGLVRAQFEVLHQWSAERGQLAQVITGIPNYYRQFEYEMGLALGGGRSGFEPNVPRLKDGEAEPFKVRPATVADLPFIAELYNTAVKGRERVTCERTLEEWKYELSGRTARSLGEVAIKLIETPAREPVGYLVHATHIWGGEHGNGLAAWCYELKAGLSWLAVTPSVVRHLWDTGKTYADAENKTIQRFTFSMPENHPVYEACAGRLPHSSRPYAYYVRVADVGGFLKHVAPALEARLARSVAAGHTGELKLNFYRTGVRLGLENGRLATVDRWQPTSDSEGDASFPNLTFLQLLLGYRSLDELRLAYADCGYHNDTARALVNALFPRQPSHVWALT
jgi:hypothetical protein